MQSFGCDYVMCDTIYRIFRATELSITSGTDGSPSQIYKNGNKSSPHFFRTGGRVIGGSKEGARDASPRGSKFFHFHAVFSKNLKNNSNFGSWCTPPGENPGSATESGVPTSKWT